MPTPSDDELSTVDLSDLANVTGGAGDDMSSMLPMMMMMRKHPQAAAPAPAAPAWKPKITVDGVDQALTNNGNGTFSTSSEV